MKTMIDETTLKAAAHYSKQWMQAAYRYRERQRQEKKKNAEIERKEAKGKNK